MLVSRNSAHIPSGKIMQYPPRYRTDRFVSKFPGYSLGLGQTDYTISATAPSGITSTDTTTLTAVNIIDMIKPFLMVGAVFFVGYWYRGRRDRKKM